MSEIKNIEFKRLAIEVGFESCKETELEIALSLAEQAEAYQKLYNHWKFELDQGLVQHETKHLNQLESTIRNCIVKHQRVVIIPHTGRPDIDETDEIFTVKSINTNVDILEIMHPNGTIWTTHVRFIRPATKKEILMQKRLAPVFNQ